MLLLMVLCVGLPARAQNITVNGVVEDSAGEPMIGATVLVDGSKDGVATDFDGNFTIKCAPNAKLHVSYIGYKPQGAGDGDETASYAPASRRNAGVRQTPAMRRIVFRYNPRTDMILRYDYQTYRRYPVSYTHLRAHET